MINNYVTNIQPIAVVFDTVTTNTTAGTYTQLASHANVDAVRFTMTATTSPVPILVAYSSSPSTAQFVVATGTPCVVEIPTGATRNSNALFVTNTSGAAAMTLTFMCVTYDNNKGPFPSNRGSAG